MKPVGTRARRRRSPRPRPEAKARLDSLDMAERTQILGMFQRLEDG